MMIPDKKWRNYGTHLPVLLAALRRTTGPVLELGMGPNSTPVLHWLCVPHGRRLVSCESDRRFCDLAQPFAYGSHEIRYVANWDEAPCEEPWDVVLVDHEPAPRRIVEIARLAPYAKYLVVHDTCGRDERFFHYRPTFDTFAHTWQFHETRPKTSVLSNLVDLRDFAV